MSRQHLTRWFAVSTDRGTGWHRTYRHAMSAARWMACESDRPVDVASDATGETWRVPPPLSAAGS